MSVGGVAAELRGFGWAGYDIGDKLGLIWNVRPNRARSLKFKIGNRLRRCEFFNISHLSEKSFEAFALSLHRFRPEFIRDMLDPSTCSLLFLESTADSGFVRRQFSRVAKPSAALSKNHRSSVRLQSLRLLRKCRSVVCRCTMWLRRGFHATDENVLVEIVKNGERVSIHEKGDVLLTNLQGYAMPFIRYDGGDTGRIVDNDCSCGRELSMLEVLGRTNECFVTKDGSFVFIKDFQRFFNDVLIMDFEVVQSSLDEIIVKIVPKLGFSDRHSDFIVRNLKYVGSAKVRVELVDSLGPQKSGKIRHIVPKVHTDYT